MKVNTKQTRYIRDILSQTRNEAFQNLKGIFYVDLIFVLFAIYTVMELIGM